MSGPRLEWNSEELQAIQATRLFEIKGTILKKVWGHLECLREALRREIGEDRLLAPSDIDRETGQVAKGENHLFLPYVYLDFPKYFSRTEKCTFRTFFWWGHYVVYALILDGPLLPQYKERIIRHYDSLATGDLHLAVTEHPWEWRRGTPFTLSLTLENQKDFIGKMKEMDFIKLERFLDIETRPFQEGEILDQGVKSFRLFKPILTA